MSGGDLELAFRHDATLGECLQWHAASGRWWWTDIQEKTLHAWAPKDGTKLSIALPDRLGCFAHTRGGRLILGFAKSLFLGTLMGSRAHDSMNLSLERLAEVEAELPHTRINDGRCDRSGRLVFGTLNESADRAAIGGIYQYSRQDGLRRLLLPPVAIANSICFSPDGRRMYFCDTLTQAIQQCDYDAESATVGVPRPFVEMRGTSSWPDGSTTDALGCLWNAQWGSGRISRYAPDGRLLQSLRMPAQHSTCPALGGEDGNQLLVTTARQDLDAAALKAMPLSGSLFGASLSEAIAVAETLFDDGPPLR